MTTGSRPLRQTIGVSPAPVRQKPFGVLSGTSAAGGESYDLQSENVRSLLQQRGAPVGLESVLQPNSPAKPSFIIERLIVLSVTGASGNAGSGNSGGRAGSSAPSGPQSGAPSGAGVAAQPQGPTDAERTVTAVRRVVDAEISRGSGRLGGTHRRKLQFLRAALVSLEQANQVGSAVASAIGGASGGNSGIVTGQGSNGQGQSKIDPREIFYGNARAYARTADRLTPRGF